MENWSTTKFHPSSLTSIARPHLLHIDRAGISSDNYHNPSKRYRLLCFQRPGGYLKTFPPSLFWPAVIIPSPFPRCSFNVTSHGHFHYAQPFINSGALCRPPRPDPRPTEEGQHPSIREKRINNTQEREREQNVHQCRSPGPSLPLEGEFRKKDFR